MTGNRGVRELRRGGRGHRVAVAAGAVERRAAARHGRRREAGRGHAVADRARRKRRGQIDRPARRAALFLVRRGRSTRRRHLACDAGRRPRRRIAARSPATSSSARASRSLCATPAGSIWQVRNSWNSTNEALFSAWIEKLFDAPPDQDLSWKVWHEVLRDRSRNFLFNYLGRDEDMTQTGPRPDCADFVYFLRAYFAFKMGLPFGYSNCSRGVGGKPPKCYQWFDIEHPEVTRPPPPPEPDAAAAAAGAPPPPAAQTPSLLRFVRPIGAAGRDAPTVTRRLRRHLRRSRSARPISSEYLRDVGDVVHTGAVRAGRRQYRFLHRAADATGAAPGHGVRRPLRPRADAGAAACRK